MNDINAARCRNMWAEVLLAVLADYNADHCKQARAKDGNPQVVLDDALCYFRSADGRTVTGNAGITIRMDAILSLIALPRHEFTARHARMEEAA